MSGEFWNCEDRLRKIQSEMKRRKTECVGRRNMSTAERRAGWSEQFDSCCIKVRIGQKLDEPLKNDMKEN